MKTKTIYILVEDSRDTGLLRGDGITGQICYSLKEACETLLRRVWYYEPAQRTWIKEKWAELGPIKAWHEHVCTVWLYCPVYVKRRIKIDD